MKTSLKTHFPLGPSEWGFTASFPHMLTLAVRDSFPELREMPRSWRFVFFCRHQRKKWQIRLWTPANRLALTLHASSSCSAKDTQKFRNLNLHVSSRGDLLRLKITNSKLATLENTWDKPSFSGNKILSLYREQNSTGPRDKSDNGRRWSCRHPGTTAGLDSDADRTDWGRGKTM